MINKLQDTEKISELRALSRRYSDTSILMHEAIARKAGLSGTDHKYLGLLIERGAMTAGEFSKLTALTTGAVTGLVDRLEKKKLVKREFDKHDRRKVIIVPRTENVIKLLQPLFLELDGKTTALVTSFSDRELEVLEKYFRSAVQIMEETLVKLTNHA
ncbi:MarR family winged helix-turn-helix transcriptional regulator [Parapedobacter indicus]|uniref:DNA-binding transcriptional regulator, MarR family n=1 Tax=Parapedobacter indicus TaxID=1477437 RepID=A0A1I3RZD4_9SPHI|nr:MarR family transcriptional regulator [Parapedobacter indicus]PPK99914.1 DNA-binding MarR family transcriptional regulator [Parapedobacter indicus]SFJ52004.1 DNA-binding transcriptional regulator, MarR family [Parapedobacter indicus]